MHKKLYSYCNNTYMHIKGLFTDIFERVDFLDKEVENPFLVEDNYANPFAKFFSATYVWVDPIGKEKSAQ